MKAVLFDAGNTVLFPDYRVFRDVLAGNGISATAAQLFQLDCELRYEYNRLAVTGQDTSELWEKYWVNLLARVGTPQELRETVTRELSVRNDRDEIWTYVLDGTPKALEKLKEDGRTLGVISNSEGRIERLLENAGLRGYFDFVIDSAIVGMRKPDRGIFQLALEVVKGQPDEVLYTGDNYVVDILGARRLGIRAVLLNPLARGDGFDCPTVKTLEELASMITR